MSQSRANLASARRELAERRDEAAQCMAELKAGQEIMASKGSGSKVLAVSATFIVDIFAEFLLFPGGELLCSSVQSLGELGESGCFCAIPATSQFFPPACWVSTTIIFILLILVYIILLIATGCMSKCAFRTTQSLLITY